MGLDAHCHLQFAAFDDDREEALGAARAAGVRGVILADYDEERRGLSVELASSTEGVWACCGLHPWAVADRDDDELEASLQAVKEALGEHPFCAVGELGMDYYRAKGEEERARQERAFVRQLGWARELNLPVVIHAVRCHNSLVKVLRREGVPEAGGILHGYSGSPRQVGTFLMMNLDLSVGTPLVWGDQRARESVKQCPLDRLLVETDAPDRPADRSRGRNEVKYLGEVIDAVASIRGEPAQKVREATEENARRRFALGDGTL